MSEDFNDLIVIDFNDTLSVMFNERDDGNRISVALSFGNKVISRYSVSKFWPFVNWRLKRLKSKMLLEWTKLGDSPFSHLY